MPPFDIYGALGVPTDATPDQIKAAHRRLVRRHHPDRDASAVSQERFLQIQRAYEVLSDAALRAEYDHRINQVRQRDAAAEHTKRTSSGGPGVEPVGSRGHESPAEPRATAKAQDPLPSVARPYREKAPDGDTYEIRESPRARHSHIKDAKRQRHQHGGRDADATGRSVSPSIHSDVDLAKDVSLRAAACVAVLSALVAAIVCIYGGFILLALIAAPAAFVLYFVVVLGVTYPLARVVVDAIRVGRWMSIRILRKPSMDASLPAIFVSTAARSWMFASWAVLCLAAPFAIGGALGSLDDRRLEERELIAPLLALAVVFDVECLYAGTVWLCMGLRQHDQDSSEDLNPETQDDREIATDARQSRRTTRHSRAVALNN